MSYKGPKKVNNDVMADDFGEFEQTGSFKLPAWSYRVKVARPQIDSSIAANIDSINYKIRFAEAETFGGALNDNHYSATDASNSPDHPPVNRDFVAEIGKENPVLEKLFRGFQLIGEGLHNYWEGVQLIADAASTMIIPESQKTLLDMLELGVHSSMFEGEIRPDDESVMLLLNRFRTAQSEQSRQLHAGKLLYLLRREKNN